MEKTNNGITECLPVNNFKAFNEIIDQYAYFIIDGISLDIVHDIVTAVYPMKEQHMIEDFTKTLTEILNVKILYMFKSGDGRNYKMVAYSMPYIDEMYVVGIESEQYGIVEEIAVTFYNTIEVMFQHLINCLESIQSRRENLIKLQTMTDLYRDFI